MFDRNYTPQANNGNISATNGETFYFKNTSCFGPPIRTNILGLTDYISISGPSSTAPNLKIHTMHGYELDNLL